MLNPVWSSRSRTGLPELPAEKKERFVKEFGIPAYDAGVLTASRNLAAYFEETVAQFPNPKSVSNWIMTELMRQLKGEEDGIAACPVTPGPTGRSTQAHRQRNRFRKDRERRCSSRCMPGELMLLLIIEEQGLVQVSDTGELQGVWLRRFWTRIRTRWASTSMARRSSWASSWGRL